MFLLLPLPACPGVAPLRVSALARAYAPSRVCLYLSHCRARACVPCWASGRCAILLTVPLELLFRSLLVLRHAFSHSVAHRAPWHWFPVDAACYWRSLLLRALRSRPIAWFGSQVLVPAGLRNRPLGVATFCFFLGHVSHLSLRWGGLRPSSSSSSLPAGGGTSSFSLALSIFRSVHSWYWSECPVIRDSRLLAGFVVSCLMVSLPFLTVGSPLR